MSNIDIPKWLFEEEHGSVKYINGLKDIENSIGFYKEKGYTFDIENIIEKISKEDNYIQRQFISIMYMIGCVEDEKYNLDLINSNYNRAITNKKIQDTVYNYFAKIDSLIDYIDKLSNKVDVRTKFNRDNIDVAVKVSGYRNEILHEGIPYIRTKNIGERRDVNETLCCQYANDSAFEYSYIELEFMDNELISLHDMVEKMNKPMIREINKFFDEKNWSKK